MHRMNLISLLSTYTPMSEEERVHKQTILTFVEQHATCFERSHKDGHITASAFLLNKHETHALLMHHKKLNMWVQVGGHCDGNSDVLAVALQEAQEESGIMHIVPVFPTIFDIDVHTI